MTLSPFNGDKQAYAQEILGACPPRYATLDDVDRIVDFDRAVFPEGSQVGRRYLGYHIADNPIGIEVLEIDHQIAACIIGETYPSHIEKDRWYGDIALLGVGQDYRGRGLGDLLLGRMVKSMLAENPTGISLRTRVSNTPMQSLATKYGFTIESTVEDYYARSLEPEDAYLMVYRHDKP